MKRSPFARVRASADAVFGSSLFARSMRSSAFTIIQFGGENALRLASNLILTRLLFPEAFGLMSLVAVVMSGLNMFSDIGTRAAVMQNPRGLEPHFLNTAWTIQIIRCAVLWLLTCILALPLSRLYEEPLLALLLPVAGLNLLMSGFGSTRAFEVNRHLQLGRLTTLILGTQLLGLIAMAVLAWLTHSVWALVIGGLISTLAKTILTHVALPGTPNRIFIDRDVFLQLFRFGQWIFVASLAGFVVRQGDRAVLGKFVTMADLGVYNIAYFMATVPVLLCNALSGNVMFPLYTLKNPAESAANRRKLSKARFTVSATLLSGITFFALAGDWIVRLLYDARYYDAGPLLILIALATLPELLIATYADALLAAGNSARFAILLISRAVVQSLLLFLLVAQFGIVAAPVALFVATLLVYPLALGLIRPLRVWDPLHDVFVMGASGSIIGAAFWYHSDLLGPLLAPLVAAL